MALDRAGSSPTSPHAPGGPQAGTAPRSLPLGVSAAALQRYEEPVFCVTAEGRIEPANPVAAEFATRLLPEDIARLTAAAVKSKTADRALVDMVDVGRGDKSQNLQVTLVPLDEGQGTLLFVRDLTLDNSLRLALVDSRRRYKDFIDISTDFAWETGADRRFSFVPPRGALGYSADGLMAMEPVALMVTESSSGDSPFLTRRRIENEEAWLRTSDGRSACVVVSAMPLVARDGTWLGARGVCRDVTEIRDREATLTRVRNRERVLTRIVRAFRDEVNPEAMLGVAAEALAKGLGAEHCHIFRTMSAEPGQLAANVPPANVPANPTPGFQLAARYGDLNAAQAAPVLTTIAGGAGAVELLLGDRQVLAAPARYQSDSNGAVVLWRPVERGAWSDDDRLLIGDIANQVGITIEQFTHHEHVLRISRTDALTGLLNRGAFMDALKRFLSRLKRDGGNAVLMYVDLDNFKIVNDVRGHQAGDDLLMKIRDILVQQTRPTDMIARLGGDEFAVYLNGADLTIAKTRATQFLERIKGLVHLSGSPERPVGMSIGIAVWEQEANEELDAFLARADAAMYKAKRGGKGSFTIADSPVAAKA
ncbi:MAG: diguanylate cyclase [Rhodospirillaceae bacterium]|nr:diguanylate cyclase [Rhodospirillaceae bacterium]